MIYFIQDESGPIKIGVSEKEKVWIRLTALQIGNPRPLQILGIMSGEREEETKLHKQFVDCHIRGEWFVNTHHCWNSLINGQCCHNKKTKWISFKTENGLKKRGTETRNGLQKSIWGKI